MKQTTKELYKLQGRIREGLHSNHIKSEQQLLDRSRSYRNTILQLESEGLTRTGKHIAYYLMKEITTREEKLRSLKVWLWK